jgi:cation:H+ antiporter
MVLGALLLVVAGAALVGGSALLGSGLADAARQRSAPAATVRAVAIGLAGALAATVIAVGQQRTALASGVPFGATMFLLASAFGAAALLGRRPLQVREPVSFAAPAAAVVLVTLSLSTDRSFTRIGGLLLTVVFVPYLVWVLLEPSREQAGGDGPTYDDLPWGAVPPAGAWGDRADGAEHETPDPAPERAATHVTAAGEAPPAEHPRRPPFALPLLGLALVVGGAFAAVEGATRIGERAPLLPGFAGAALAGSLVALPFTLLVVFPRRRDDGVDPSSAALTVVTGLLTFVPGVAAIVRPFDVDGPAAICVLASALLYALPGTWMLLRGKGGRVMGALVLVAYAACLLYAGSL